MIHPDGEGGVEFHANLSRRISEAETAQELLSAMPLATLTEAKRNLINKKITTAIKNGSDLAPEDWESFSIILPISESDHDSMRLKFKELSDRRRNLDGFNRVILDRLHGRSVSVGENQQVMVEEEQTQHVFLAINNVYSNIIRPPTLVGGVVSQIRSKIGGLGSKKAAPSKPAKLPEDLGDLGVFLRKEVLSGQELTDKFLRDFVSICLKDANSTKSLIALTKQLSKGRMGSLGWIDDREANTIIAKLEQFGGADDIKIKEAREAIQGAVQL